MRLTLENSQSFSVSFSAERESLDLYLELEALRADGKFVYEIVVDDNISNEITIPSLIVQPFVENAIWHGVIPKGGGGRISVVFKMSDKRILCSIEDNGIGRVEAEKYASAKAHKSLGSKITMQRLQLLKSMYGQQLGIVYVDLKDSLGAPIGTKVELAIPILPSKVILD
jgi:LytS/YehU family sensor histidine kinase